MEPFIKMKQTSVWGVGKRQHNTTRASDSSIPFCLPWSRKHQFLTAPAGTVWIQTFLAAILIHQYLLQKYEYPTCYLLLINQHSGRLSICLSKCWLISYIATESPFQAIIYSTHTHTHTHTHRGRVSKEQTVDGVNDIKTINQPRLVYNSNHLQLNSYPQPTFPKPVHMGYRPHQHLASIEICQIQAWQHCQGAIHFKFIQPQKISVLVHVCVYPCVQCYFQS